MILRDNASKDFYVCRNICARWSGNIPIVTALAAIFAIVRVIFITTDLFHRRHDSYLSWCYGPLRSR